MCAAYPFPESEECVCRWIVSTRSVKFELVKSGESRPYWDRLTVGEKLPNIIVDWGSWIDEEEEAEVSYVWLLPFSSQPCSCLVVRHPRHLHLNDAFGSMHVLRTRPRLTLATESLFSVACIGSSQREEPPNPQHPTQQLWYRDKG